jgi:uncharacterized membrane protein
MAGMVEVWFKYAIIIIIIKTDRSMVEVGVVSPFFAPSVFADHLPVAGRSV